MTALFAILVFPGLFFMALAGVAAEFVDRRLYARFQNRMGPPWFQPVADLIKLFAKETIIPAESEPRIFQLLPLVAMASVVTAILYIPLWGVQPLFSFDGDLIVVMYLLTIPTMCIFLAGWYSTSLYSMIGAVRALTQMYAYEVPLFLAVLSPALLSGSWSLSGMAQFFAQHPGQWILCLPGFLVAFVALQGKLERVPFDIPEAETEIVGGAFTEYSGRLLGLFRLTLDMEAITGASLLAAAFLPFGLSLHPALGFALYLVKVLFIVFGVALVRSVFARLRIEQMVDFCWKYMAPLAFLQILVILLVKAVTGA